MRKTLLLVTLVIVYISSTASTALKDSTSYSESSEADDENDVPQDRSLSVTGPGLGWAASTAIMIFAFANTVLVGSTLVVTYITYQILISVLAVVVPNVALTFQMFLNLFI